MHAERRPPVLALAYLTLAAVGAGTSLLLLHEYLWPDAGACGPGGGCEAVRSSAYSSLLGVPLPIPGLLYFGAFIAVLLVPVLRTRGRLVVLSVVGGITAAVLYGLQGLVIGAWCPYCLVVDTCCLGLATAAFVPSLTVRRPLMRGPTAAAVVAIGIALPIAIGVSQRPPPPTPSEANEAATLATATVDDGTTIVEFIDFQCPYCRRQHARMAEVLADYGERVELTLHHWPLDRLHPQAREAARVACCAQEQGVGEAAIDALMRTDDLSAEGCRAAVQTVGADADVLAQCLESERPDQQLEADAAKAEEYGVRALPTCFIGGQRFEGLQKEEVLRAAIDQALASTERG
ncbi:MAG: thioredoxin domain-containing protein [Nannocystaceae bacterium]